LLIWLTTRVSAIEKFPKASSCNRT